MATNNAQTKFYTDINLNGYTIGNVKVEDILQNNLPDATINKGRILMAKQTDNSLLFAYSDGTQWITTANTTDLPKDYLVSGSISQNVISLTRKDTTLDPLQITIPQATDTSLGVVIVDNDLSSTSSNPLQNKKVKTALDGKANTTHIHALNDVKDSEGNTLTTLLNSKANNSHTHSLTDISNSSNQTLDTLLSNKADSVHTHTADNIIDFDTQAQLSAQTKIDSIKGTANGIASLDAQGKVPSNQLPSFVDDVVEGYYKQSDGKFYSIKSGDTYSNEITGQQGKIYVDLSTNKTYRWGTTQYVVISETLAIGTTTGTAFDGASGQANTDAINSINTTLANKQDESVALDFKDDFNPEATEISVSKTITSWLQNIVSKLTNLIGLVGKGKTEIGTDIAESQTQLHRNTDYVAGTLSLSGMIKNLAQNVAYLFSHTNDHTHTIDSITNLQTILDNKLLGYVSNELTGISGTIIATQHHFNNIFMVQARNSQGEEIIIQTKIDNENKVVTWQSNTAFVSGAGIKLYILGN